MRTRMPQEELLVVVAAFLAILGVAAFSMSVMAACGVFPLTP